MRYALAIDLGGTHASIGIVRGSALVAARDMDVEAHLGLASALPPLAQGGFDLLREAGVKPAQCAGISLSLPSLVDFYKGRVVSANNKYADATGVDLQHWARETFGLPLVLENDARAALLGEARSGAARGYKDVLMLTLGTGVGSAVLTGGMPFRTAQPQGGNLGGHIPVRLHGRQCSCGAFGCMESEASGWALPLVAREMPGFSGSSLAQEPKIDFATVFAHGDAGDQTALNLIAHCFHVWSIGIVGLVHAFGPSLIVIGGGVAARADVTSSIAQYVQRYAWAPAGPVTVLTAELGNHAPLYAAPSLLEEFFADGRPE